MQRTLITLGLVAALGVVGCSSDHAKAAKKADAGTKTAKTTSTTKPEFVANTQNTPGTLKNFVGAHADVHDTVCKANDKGWSATGKATNPTNGSVQYRIYVSFLNGDTTVGVTETDVKAARGATTDWSASVATTGTDLRCILRVERAAA